MNSHKKQELVDFNEFWKGTYQDMNRIGPVHTHMRRIVRRVLSGLEYRSVLDVGCGTGSAIGMLTADRVLDSVVGIDISQAAIEQARQMGIRGEFLVHNIQHSPLPGKWDLVHCSLVLSHVPDDNAAIRHLRHNTGKYLLVTTIAGDYARYEAWERRIGHVRNQRPGELEDKLLAVGLRVKQTIYWGFPFYSPMQRFLHNVTGMGMGKYSWRTRFIARALTALYYLNSSKRGDLLVILAEV